MAFHVAVTGYLVKKHGDICDYINIVCKRLVDKNSGKVYEKQEIIDIIKNDVDGFFDLYEIADKYTIEFYDDIEYNGEISYKYNNRFKIGNTCCAVMIYICAVGDDCGGSMETCIFEDAEIIEFISWKNKLVSEGRLDADIKFCCVPNCCC